MSKENVEKQSKAPSYVVGIGASAGGLEAIESFFSMMSPRSGMAFIVIQHLSPEYKSLMDEILSKRTRMEVLKAEDGMMVMPNHVYLITPKKSLTIFHGKLLLHDQDRTKGINLPVDIFFKSLAEDQAEKAIGIILSGTGSDGMRGVRSIKETGGFVLVQDEESAKFDGMPRSAISTGLVDFVMPPEEMPEQLLRFVENPLGALKADTERLLTDEDNLTRIFSLLRTKHKIDFTHYKMSTVVRRIKRRMTVNNIDNLIDYVRFMESTTREVTSLYKELLIGVTSFYRDKEAFHLLESNFIPELLRRKDKQEIRFWVAGCSSGEEAYSMAILCRECMEKENLLVDIKIFATDVDEEAISKAANGIYPASIAADLSPYLLRKYFASKDDNYQVVRSIREMVVFAKHNILKDPPFSNIEFISCRNLLIYLQPVLQTKVMEYFNFSLNAKGILFLGSSESIGEMMEYFDPLDHKWNIYRSNGRKRQLKNLNDLAINTERISHRQHLPGGLHQKRYALEGTLERFLEALHSDLIPLSLIVNDELEIIHVVGDISQFFKVPSGSFSTNITRMAHKELAIPLSTGLQKAFERKEDLLYSNIIFRIGEEKVNINMQIKILPEKRKQEPLAAILISINETRKEKQDFPHTQKYDIAEETEQRLYDLEQELQFTRENLQATIEELETSNEELQATNEELLASNEELQSTNEELQSVNEELHTVNAEYQTKIAELSELNSDMDNLLASTEVGTVFLDENLEIRNVTPQVQEIVGVGEKDLGRSISDIAHKFPAIDLVSIVRHVQKSGKSIEHTLKIDDVKFYLLRVLPYKITPRVASGIVITIMDISSLQSSQDALYRSERRHRVAASLAKIGYWEINLNSMKTSWTDEVYTIHELDPDTDHNVTNGIEFYHPDDRMAIQSAVEECMTKGTGFDLKLRFITAKKNARWVRSIGKAEVSNGKINNVYGAIQDITESVETQTELECREIEYKELFETITSGVVIYEAAEAAEGAVNFIVLDMNHAAEVITKTRRENVIGKVVQTVFPSVEQMGLIKVLAEVWKTGEPKTLPVREYKDDTLQFMAENNVYKLPSGEIVAVFDKVSDGYNE